MSDDTQTDQTVPNPTDENVVPMDKVAEEATPNEAASEADTPAAE